MKKCPYCAEEIQDEAILCKFCKSRLDKQEVPHTVPQAIENVSAPSQTTGPLTITAKKKKVVTFVFAIAVIAVTVGIVFAVIRHKSISTPSVSAGPVTSAMISEELKKAYCSMVYVPPLDGSDLTQCINDNTFEGSAVEIDGDGRMEYFISSNYGGATESCNFYLFDDESTNHKRFDGIGGCELKVLDEETGSHRSLLVNRMGDEETSEECKFTWDGTNYKQGKCNAVEMNNEGD